MRPLGSLQRSLQSLYRKALPMFRYITSLSLEVSTEAGEKSVERGCETRSAGYRAEFWRPARCDTTLPGVGFMAPPYGRLGQPSRPRQPCHTGRSPMWIGRELLLLRQERSQRPGFDRGRTKRHCGSARCFVWVRFRFNTNTL